jgi:hypothetical protein
VLEKDGEDLLGRLCRNKVLHSQEVLTIKGRIISHILRRNCLLNHVIKRKVRGETQLIGRRRRRRKQLLDDLKERKSYCKLEEEALDYTAWRISF